MQTRYYDPMVKRFVNADSLFVAGDALTGSNMYAYCNGNPVMLVDPSGMRPSKEDFQLLGKILVGVLTIAENLAQKQFGLSIWSKDSKTQDFLADAFEGFIDVMTKGVERALQDGRTTINSFLTISEQLSHYVNLDTFVDAVGYYSYGFLRFIDWITYTDGLISQHSNTENDQLLKFIMFGTAAGLAATVVGPVAPVLAFLIAAFGSL